MVDHDKKLFLRENATSVLLKLGGDVNPTANGSSGVDLSLHFISTPHSSVVTHPVGRVLLNWRALQCYSKVPCLC